jgi:hypothetical protein
MKPKKSAGILALYLFVDLIHIKTWENEKKKKKKMSSSKNTPKNQPATLFGRKKYAQIKASLYSKRPALQHGSNKATGKLIRVRGAEISWETCVKEPNQTKPSIFGNFSEDISADPPTPAL